MIPDMGYHFLNPTIQGFDPTKPHILVYERRGRSLDPRRPGMGLPQTPATPPLPGATYGSFAAACHYTDGTFVFAAAQDDVRHAQPRDRRPVQLLAPGPGDPARVAVVPQPRRPLQRHQPPDPTLQPGIADPSATKAGTRARTSSGPGLEPPLFRQLAGTELDWCRVSRCCRAVATSQPITEAMTAMGTVSAAVEPASRAASIAPKNDSPNAAGGRGRRLAGA